MRHKLLVSIAAVLIGLVVTVAGSSIFSERSKADDDQSGSGWEYLVVQGGTVNLTGSDGGSMRKEPGAFSRESFPLEKNLDKLGAKGWELVTVAGSPADPIFYLKRRK